MCGRYTLTLDMETLQAHFPFAIEEIAFVPRDNIAPSQQVLTYGAQGPKTAAYMKWGLITNGIRILKTIKSNWYFTNSTQPLRGARSPRQRAGSHATALTHGRRPW
jgi:putative SOS response-associated peptidase YedK